MSTLLQKTGQPLPGVKKNAQQAAVWARRSMPTQRHEPGELKLFTERTALGRAPSGLDASAGWARATNVRRGGGIASGSA